MVCQLRVEGNHMQIQVVNVYKETHDAMNEAAIRREDQQILSQLRDVTLIYGTLGHQCPL